MEDLIKDIILAVVALAAALLNIIEILLILRIRKRKAFDKLLLSLAVSDAAIGMILSAYKIFEILKSQQLPMNHRPTVFGLSVSFSIANLLAISVDRLLAVKYPIKHRMMLTSKRANIAIVVLWILTSIVASLCGLIALKWRRHLNFLLNITQVLLLGYGILLIAIYSHIFYLVCKRKVPTASTNGETSTVRTRILALFTRRSLKSESTILFTGATVTATFIICTYPSAIEFLIKQTTKFSFRSVLMLLLNSVLNPIIYFFKSYLGSRRK